MTIPYQQPQYPQYPPQAPAYPQYAPAPQQQQYAPPGYPPQYQAAAPQQPLAAGTLDSFYNQPSSGGGPALKFDQPGTRYVGIVSRPVGDGDIQQQTDTQNRPQTFKDGRPKFVMKVPLQMQPSPQYPDGLAQWYVKGQARDELVRAMAAAGAPEGPPEHGSVLDITFTATRASGPGMNPAKLFQVNYTRPQGAPQAAPAAPPVATSPAPGPAQQQYQQPPVQAAPQQYAQPAPGQAPPQQYAAAPAQQAPPANYAPAPVQQPYDFTQHQQPAAPATQQYAPAPQQQAAPVAPATPQPPSDLSPEQQALLASLTGAQAPATNG